MREAYAIPYSVSPCTSVFGLTRASVRSSVGFTLLSFYTDGGMAKIQIITALTLDGYLPAEGGKWMEWFRHDREGLPLWLDRCMFTLFPGYPLIDLMCELKSMGDGCTYAAEVTDAGQVELLRGLFLYRMVDELVSICCRSFPAGVSRRWQTCPVPRHGRSARAGVSATASAGWSIGKRRNDSLNGSVSPLK